MLRRAFHPEAATNLVDVKGNELMLKDISPRDWGAFTISLIVMGLWVYESYQGRAKDDQLLNAAVMLVLGYWIGSSSASKAKDAVIAAQLPAPTNPPDGTVVPGPMPVSAPTLAPQVTPWTPNPLS